MELESEADLALRLLVFMGNPGLGTLGLRTFAMFLRLIVSDYSQKGRISGQGMRCWVEGAWDLLMRKGQ